MGSEKLEGVGVGWGGGRVLGKADLWIPVHGKNESKRWAQSISLTHTHTHTYMNVPTCTRTHLRGVDLLENDFFISFSVPLSLTDCWVAAAASTLLEGDLGGLEERGTGIASFSRGLGTAGA